MDNLSNTIKYARRQQQKTLRDVAMETELSVAYLSDIERGRTRPSLDTCKKIMKCLSIEIIPYTEKPLSPTECELLAAWNDGDYKVLLSMISEAL